VFGHVVRVRWVYFEIGRGVVQFIAVFVVYDFSFLQGAFQHVFGNNAVFVNVALRVR
jgi:hypothetical protein